MFQRAKQRLRPSSPAPSTSSDVKDTAKEIGKIVLDLLVEVSEALPPLKSAAAGLKVIVDYAEVSGHLCHFSGSLVLTAKLESWRQPDKADESLWSGFGNQELAEFGTEYERGQ